MKIEKKLFGIISDKEASLVRKGAYDGKEVYNYTMTAASGMNVTVSEFGAIIKDITVPDKDGHLDTVVLTFDTLEEFMNNSLSFGAPVGRCANRTKNAAFSINGTEYQLVVNDGPNNLHSGSENNYYVRPFETVAYAADDAKAYVKLHLSSPDGDQGFPGNLELYITYSLDEAGNFEIRYEGNSDKDTVFNITNHSYFNLGGHNSGNALNSIVWIDADGVTASDAENIPTGEIFSVANTAFDFRTPKTLIKDIHTPHSMLEKGYDCNYVLNNNGKLQPVAYMKHESNGRKMLVTSDLPGMQLYTGNYIDEKGKDNTLYGEYHGICFETQFYPDAVNHSNFPSPVIKAGETFSTTTIYTFTVE